MRLVPVIWKRCCCISTILFGFSLGAIRVAHAQKTPPSEPPAGTEPVILEGGVAGLVAKLKNKDRLIRKRAVEELAQIGPPAIPLLIQDLEAAYSQPRYSAREALSKIGPPAVPGLIEALKDERGPVRTEAALVLGDMGAAAAPAIPALAVGLQRNETQIGGAFAALAGIGPASVPTLIQVLKNDEAIQRSNAAWALGEIGAGARTR